MLMLSKILKYSINNDCLNNSFQFKNVSVATSLNLRLKLYQIINKDLSFDEIRLLCIMESTSAFNTAECIPFCKTCVYGANNNCVDCLSGKTLVYSNRMQECQDGYEIKSDDMPFCCIKNCSQCNHTIEAYRNDTNLSISNCSVCYNLSNQKCYVNGTNNICYCSCLTKQYFNYYSHTCQNCFFLCSECMISSTNCSNCIDAAELESNMCVCTVGYFHSANNSCLPCAWPCVKCSSKLNTTCKTCIDQSYLIKLYSPSTCDCIEEYYNYNNTYYRPCHPLCRKCFGDYSTTCTQCKQLPGIEITQLTHCICSTKFYYDQDKATCLPCHPLCENCIIAYDLCLGCYDNYSSEPLKNGTCVCKRHFYYDNGECFECHPLCEDCYQPMDDYSCSTCIDSREVTNITENGKMRCVCSVGFYFNINVNFCEACNSACYSCTGGTAYECILCSKLDVYLRRDGNCLPNCTLISMRRVCIDCNIFRCKKCTQSQCVECISHYFLSEGECKEDCPVYTYKNIISGIGQCSKCYYKCLTCSGSKANQCIDCDIQYMKDNQQIYCITKVCNPNELMLDFICYPCHSSCKSCSGLLESQCLTCFYGAVIVANGSNIFCKKCNDINIGLAYSGSTQTCTGNRVKKKSVGTALN